MTTDDRRPARTTKPVRFIPLCSTANPTFWLDYNSRKLNDLKLSVEGTPLHGYIGISGNAVRFDVADVSLRRNEAIQTCKRDQFAEYDFELNNNSDWHKGKLGICTSIDGITVVQS
jgi:hypothetical protein